MNKEPRSKLNTKSLFLELLDLVDQDKHNPKYTIEERHCVKKGVEYISLYQLYMESVDEFDFAMKHMTGLDYWNKLLNTKWFTEGYRQHRGIDSWREDMRMRDESRAKQALMLAVSTGDISAARKLYDISRPVKTTKRGRFLKEEVVKEAVKKVEDKEFLDNAALRLNVISIRD